VSNVCGEDEGNETAKRVYSFNPPLTLTGTVLGEKISQPSAMAWRGGSAMWRNRQMKKAVA